MPLLRLHNTESGLTVCTFRFDPMLVDAMKANGMRFDPDGKKTSFPKSWWTDDPAVAEKLKLVAGEADARAIHAELTRTRRETVIASYASDSSAEFPCPKGLSYMPYQRAGISYAVAREGTLFGDEPGLGKTVEAIGVLNADRNLLRALVVCPASLKTNWLRELKKWLVYQDLTVGVAHGGYLPDTNIVVINYDIVARHKPALLEVKWDAIILDEAHLIKNPQTQRARAICGFRSHSDKSQEEPPLWAKRRLALTGTPILNRPAEIWTTLNWLAPSAWASRGSFGRRYCAGGTSFFDGASNLEELQVRLRSSVMIRRLKKDVLTELPAKMRQVIEFDDPDSAGVVKAELTALEKYQSGLAMLKAAAELAKASDNPEEYKDAVLALRSGVSAAFEELAKLRYDTAMAKVPYVIGHLKQLAEEMPDEKFIVFAHHHDVIDRIYNAFPWQAVKLVGDMPTEERQKSVDRFQTDKSVRLFVGSMRAAGVGLTLTASSHVVFAELDWVPATISQAEDRCILAGTPVMTEAGWMPIERVRVGQRVVGRDGMLHEVVDAWDRGCVECVTEVRVEGWPEALRTTSDHKYLLRDGRWVMASELHPRDEIAMPAVPDCPALESVDFSDELRVDDEFIGAGGKQSNGRLVHAPKVVELSDEALFCMGYYVGDGFSAIGSDKGRFVSFAGHQVKDAEPFRRIEAWLSKFGVTATTRKRPAPGLGMEMRAYSAEWARWFYSQFGHGAYNKHLPEWVWSLSVSQRLALLSGLAQSDGYNRGGGGRIDYVTASSRLAYQVFLLASSSGFRPSYSITSKGFHQVTWCAGATSGTVLEVRHTMPARVGTSRTRERVYDLTVKDSASFVIGNSVVHNCHRVGQKEAVLVQHLVLAGSLDAVISRRIIDKQAVIDQALDRAPASADVVIPNISVEAYEEARIEEIDRVSSGFTPEQAEQVRKSLMNLKEPANPVDQIIVSRLKELPRFTSRQAALAKRVMDRNK